MNKKNKLDVLSMLSEQQAEVIRIQAEMAKDAFSTIGLSYDEIRANYTKERVFWNEGGPQMAEKTDVLVPGEKKQIPVRILRPEVGSGKPCIFYIHGGGFTVGNNDTHERIMRVIADQSKAVVVGIDYSLSPEAKYPTALLECVEVFKYFRQNAEKYGIDKDKLGFAGDSGGAALSMSSYLYLRDNGEAFESVKALLLYYGMYGLQDAGGHKLFGGPWDGMEQEDLDFYLNQYVEKPEDMESPYINAYNNDLTVNMPACFIVSAELDPLVDDSKTLYTILKAKGFDCEYVDYKGALHAFLHYSKIMDDAFDALKKGAEFFNKRL